MLKIFVNNKVEQQKSGFIFGLACVLVFSFGLILSIIQPGTIHTDGGIFTAIAIKDLHADGLYITAWENKPPGIFYLIEIFILIFKDPVYAVFALSFLTLTCSAICLYIIIYKNIASLFASLLLSLVAIYFAVYKNNIGDGLYTEIFGTCCILLSMVFHMYYEEKGKKVLFKLSAIMLGFSFWFKEPFILMCIPLICIYLIKKENLKASITYLLWACLPSILFVLLLAIRGSLSAYLDVFLYNVSYISSEENITLKVKLNDVYLNLLKPSSGLVILLIYLAYRTLQNKTQISVVLLYILLLTASSSFIILSPHNFGHYYYPLFAIIFVVLSALYKIDAEKTTTAFVLPLILLSIYTFYRIDQVGNPSLKYTIDTYYPDKISKYLKRQSSAKNRKTLFVDYVVKSDYYAKTGLIFPTYLPVALPIHFGENGIGKLNRKRIWEELSANPPDYLITTYTTSYFSWFFPESNYYDRNYHKIDSIEVPDENILYLWEHNTQEK